MTGEIEKTLRDAAARLPEPTPELAERLAGHAEREGLVDVAYTTHDTPVGTLTLAATETGLVTLAYGDTDPIVERLAARVSPRVMELPKRLDRVRRELDEYFDGSRRDFDLPLDWSLTRGFTQKVLRATYAIPFGQVSTYAGVAEQAGSARAVRAAGNALGSNPIPVIVPCHRVLRTGGGLGGYTGGLDRKQYLLQLEGVEL